MFSVIAVLLALLAQPSSASDLLDCERPFLSSAEDSDPWNQAFLKQTRADIERDLEYYLREKRRGSPVIAMLETLGFRFEPGAVIVPSIFEVFRTYEAYMGNLVAEGRLSNSDVLVPRRVVSNWQGTRFQFVELGDTAELDGGWSFHRKILPDDTFLEMVRFGFFPAGENEYTVNGNRHTALHHDLFHFVGFMLDPDYMKALRHGLAQIRRQRLDVRQGTPLAVRILYATEEVVVAKPGSSHELRALLNLPLKPSGLHTVNEVQALLRAMPVSERIAYLRRVFQEYKSHLLPLGGTAADLILNEVFANLGSYVSGSLVDQTLSRIAASAEVTLEIEEPDFLIEQARFITLLAGISEMNSVEWVQSALAEKVPEASRLFELFCKTGLWSESHPVFRAHCIDSSAPILPYSKQELYSEEELTQHYARYLSQHPQHAIYLADPKLISTLQPKDAGLLEALLSLNHHEIAFETAKLLDQNPEFTRQPRVFERLISSDEGSQYALGILERPHWAQSRSGAELLVKLLQRVSSEFAEFKDKQVICSYAEILRSRFLTSKDWASNGAFSLVRVWTAHLEESCSRDSESI